ncbi:PilZ domain-containing protein [Deltaproteobacteria bacterium TL4]
MISLKKVKDIRFSSVHKVTLKKEHLFYQGHSLDLSKHGISIAVNGKLDEVGGYKARFHLLRDKGLSMPETLVEQEGVVKWIFFKDGTSTIGIEFDNELSFPNNFEDEILESSYCYIHISHSSIFS